MKQSPLLRTQSTAQGLTSLRQRPRAIVLGLGLGSHATISRGLPFDTLGMLLAAEQLRRAVDGARVVVLIADRHALTNGFAQAEVSAQARHVERQLLRVRRALDVPLEVLRAQDVHQSAGHHEIVSRLRERSARVHPYVELEVADTEFMRRRYGSIIKLGWSRSDKVRSADRALDERFFDERFRAWIGGDVGFAYTAAGRTLDARRPWAAPYLTVDPRSRLLLAEHELRADKLERYLAHAASTERRFVLAHLGRITCVYHRSFSRLRGTVPQRVRGVLAHIYAGEGRGQP